MVWFWPLAVFVPAVLLSVPLGLLLARLLDRKEAVGVERYFDTGPQRWPAYAFAMLLLNALTFVVGFLVLAWQHWLPAWLNPDGKPGLAASTIFHTASSFLTNTNLQHYTGEYHLAYGSQLLVVLWKQLLTPAIGLAALLALVRGLRGDPHLGNFYLDTFRGVFYVLLPLSVVVAVLLVLGGVPMTLAGAAQATTLEGGSQTIARGPVAAVVAIKQLGTNGGGYFGVNSTHPFENPSAFTNWVECVCILLIPMACVVMFGRMIGNHRHAAVVYGVLLVGLVGLTAWGIATDAQAPNPAFAGLPIDQDGTGNLEGKELRFGPGAGPTWAAATTCTSNGSVNCMHDSLNPLAGLTPLTGMWLNCFFGGVGVGLINLMIYLIVGVFLAGLMVGRTPEYLGKKVEAREMKLAMLALLIHPVAILLPTGYAATTEWGVASMNNPAAHGLTEALYENTSAAANNGSGFEGLGDTVGFAEGASEKIGGFCWDVLTAVVMLVCRFVPIIAPLALAASLAAKKPTPFTAGTMRTDTLTFALVLLGTIVLVGALLFLPVAALGPIAEHLGPIPFKG